MQRLLIVLSLITLNACSVYSGREAPAPVESPEGTVVVRESPPLTGPVMPESPEGQNSGSPTATLMASADVAIAEGDIERAAALTERALRISPRDGYLWYRLADIRYQQERYTDAAGFAQRARSFAGSNRQLTGAIDDLLERTNEATR